MPAAKSKGKNMEIYPQWEKLLIVDGSNLLFQMFFGCRQG